jgi:hypothetical protein
MLLRDHPNFRRYQYRTVEDAVTWSNKKLFDILADCCGQFRKGPVYQGSPHLVEQMERGLAEGEELQGGGVLEVYDMPPTNAIPEECEVVDMHFVAVAVNKAKAERHRAELIALLDAYPEPEQLAGGPSYIHVGGVIGDQGLAFELFALGKVLGLWSVITPATFGMTGMEADRAAGAGYIMCSGYRPVRIPKLEPIAINVRKLDPAVWGREP